MKFWEEGFDLLRGLDIKTLSINQRNRIRIVLSDLEFMRKNETIRTFYPFPPGEKFLLAKNVDDVTARGRIFRAPNKVSKTTLGIIEGLSYAYGERVWLPKDHPDRIIDVTLPNIGAVFGKQLMKQVKLKLVPETKFWTPNSWFRGGSWEKSVKHGSQGVVCELYIRNRQGTLSVIYYFSYDSPASSYEGVDPDWIHFDEPAPQDLFNAVTRGFLSTGGLYWMSMTPLEHPWIHDELEGRSIDEGGESSDIRVISCNIGDALKKSYPIEYTKYFKKAGLKQKDIDDYALTLPKEERRSRLEGSWFHFAGVIYSILNSEIHQMDDITLLPKNWQPYEGLDPADGKDTKWLFMMVSDERFSDSLTNRYIYKAYVVGYLSLPPTATIAEMIRLVKIKRAELSYTKPRWVVVDAKYGERKQKTEHGHTSWVKELKKTDTGIRYILSESNPGDVDIGNKIVKEYLTPKYSILQDKEVPALVFFREATAGVGGPWWQMLRYRRDEKGKIDQDYEDFPSVIRYILAKRPKNLEYEDTHWPKTSYERVNDSHAQGMGRETLN